MRLPIRNDSKMTKNHHQVSTFNFMKIKKYPALLESNLLDYSTSLKIRTHLLLNAGLHNSDYHSKLVHFESTKNIYYVK
jgi:hypothetical protein